MVVNVCKYPLECKHMVVNLTWYVSEEGEDDVEDKVATTSSHHQNLLLQYQFKVSFSFLEKVEGCNHTHQTSDRAQMEEMGIFSHLFFCLSLQLCKTTKRLQPH